MARLPRYVIPGQPQHIIQRGNNRQAIIAAEADYHFFRDALVEASLKHGLAIHAYRRQRCQARITSEIPAFPNIQSPQRGQRASR